MLSLLLWLVLSMPSPFTERCLLRTILFIFKKKSFYKSLAYDDLIRQKYLLILETEGALSGVHIRSCINLSRISHANMFGLRSLKFVIDSITDGVATFGFEPPIKPGFIEPVE